MATTKTFLFILQQAPHGSFLPRDALDVILAYSAFVETASILFLGDGVFQLKKGQHPTAVGYSNFTRSYNAMDLFDIDTLYVEQSALQERSLARDDLIGEHLTLLSSNEMHQLMEKHDMVLSF